jgi:hypothetical protein
LHLQTAKLADKMQPRKEHRFHHVHEFSNQLYVSQYTNGGCDLSRKATLQEKKKHTLLDHQLLVSQTNREQM